MNSHAATKNLNNFIFCAREKITIRSDFNVEPFGKKLLLININNLIKHMSNPKRIIWMLDDTLIKSAPSHWSIIRQKTSDLFQRFGNPDMDHKIADPEPLLINLASQLAGKRFSCIIDLSGWMSDTLNSVVNTNQIIKEFRLSRIREASSPSLPTSGHIASLTESERTRLSIQADLSKPLILDDTSFSGNTSLITMKLLNIDPEKTTHGFLSLNEGVFGEEGEIPGAKIKLESIGSSTFSGMTFKTPIDDGWHVTDTWNHPKLKESLVVSRLIQEIMQSHGIDSPEAKAIWKSEVFKTSQFLNRIEPQMTRSLINEGRLISTDHQRLLNGEVHTTNPLLWISPYFIKHINIDKFLQDTDSLTSNLEAINNFVGERKNSHWETIHELKNKVEGEIFGNHPERI